MNVDDILTVTFSGVRPGEDAAVMDLIREGGLHTDDLTVGSLRHFIAARKGDAVVGVVGLEMGGETALLRSLSVKSPHRKQGMAARLVEAIERYARIMEVKALYLLTTTAHAFFEKQGYRVIDRTQAPEGMQSTAEFVSLCPKSAVCMLKKLPDPQ